MVFCKKCKGRMFVDRQYLQRTYRNILHVVWGKKFFHPPSESEQGRWILQKEKSRAKIQ
jgi:predicted alternative tryptophan synthase beta-subunit